MSKPAYTHGFRLKGSDGHFEPTTADGLEQAKKALGGAKFFAKNYEVKELAEKPADLPTVTAEKPSKEDKK